MHRRVVEPFNLSPKREGAAMVDVVPAVYGADDSEWVPSRPLSAYDPRVDSTSAILLLLRATDSAARVGKFVRGRPALMARRCIGCRLHTRSTAENTHWREVRA